MNAFWLIFTQTIPLVGWQVLLLAGLLLVIIGYCLAQVRLRIGCMVTGCLLVLVAAFFLSCYAYAQRCCWLCLLEPVQLYAGPTKRYHTLGTSSSNELVCVYKTYGEWKCIQAKACKGWAYLP